MIFLLPLCSLSETAERYRLDSVYHRVRDVDCTPGAELRVSLRHQRRNRRLAAEFRVPRRAFPVCAKQAARSARLDAPSNSGPRALNSVECRLACINVRLFIL